MNNDFIKKELEEVLQKIKIISDNLKDKPDSVRIHTKDIELTENEILFFSIYSKINPIIDTYNIYEKNLSLVLKIINAEEGSILLYDKDKKKLVFHTVIGKSKNILEGQSVSIENSLCGMCFLKQEVLSGPPLDRSLDKITGVDTKIILTAPIVSLENSVGVITAINKKGSDVFSQKDIFLFQDISEIISKIYTITESNIILNQILKKGDNISEIKKDLQTETSEKFFNLSEKIYNLYKSNPKSIDFILNMIDNLNGLYDNYWEL